MLCSSPKDVCEAKSGDIGKKHPIPAKSLQILNFDGKREEVNQNGTGIYGISRVL